MRGLRGQWGKDQTGLVKVDRALFLFRDGYKGLTEMVSACTVNFVDAGKYSRSTKEWIGWMDAYNGKINCVFVFALRDVGQAMLVRGREEALTSRFPLVQPSSMRL